MRLACSCSRKGPKYDKLLVPCECVGQDLYMDVTTRIETDVLS